MLNWRSVPVPKRMRGLQRDRRGYPTPFIILRDTDGKPMFAINDSLRVNRCIRERRCAICGNRMDGPMWFAGGPLSAFHENGGYLDTPAHHECMQYALTVCPYLAARNYDGSVGVSATTADKIPCDIALVEQTTIPGRPKLFVSVCSKTMTSHPSRVHPDSLVVVPDKPYLAMEFWCQGQQLDAEEGLRLAEQEVASAPERLVKTFVL